MIGSRDQLCIHSEVVKEPNNMNKIHMCQKFVAARSCVFYNRVEEMKNSPSFTETGIMDIEDLVRKGTANKCCPYYMAKELKNDADIVFMPYNYLLDPLARKANNIELDVKAHKFCNFCIQIVCFCRMLWLFLMKRTMWRKFAKRLDPCNFEALTLPSALLR